MRLVLPPGLRFFCRGELGQLHAMHADGYCSELLSHVFDHLLTTTLIDERASERLFFLVLGPQVAHLTLLNARLRILVRFKVCLIFLQFLQHCFLPVLF